MAKLNYVRHGAGTVRPYIYGNMATIAFLREVFGGEELEHLTNKGTSPGAHVELRIGDSVLVLEASDAWARPMPLQSVQVYVPDVDAAYARALAAGATSISAPENKPYQERACGVKDGSATLGTSALTAHRPFSRRWSCLRRRTAASGKGR